ncbi:hypothetical protein THAOC_26246, partial [Thalassiosira oceanica]
THRTYAESTGPGHQTSDTYAEESTGPGHQRQSITKTKTRPKPTQARQRTLGSRQSGIHSERDSTTEPTTREMGEDEVDLSPTIGSRAGASLGELEEGCVEKSSMPTPPGNDAADARSAPDEEMPTNEGIVVPAKRTRLQTWVGHFRDNYKSIIGLTLLAIACAAIIVWIVLGGRRNTPSTFRGNQSSIKLLSGPNVSLSRGLNDG